jgi:hypothetical protein
VENLLRYEFLVDAVRRLTRAYGSDMSQWRWEHVHRKIYNFPVWSADSLTSVDAGALPRTRYAPIVIPGAGHPSTLLWGPSRVQSEILSPASWEALITSRDWSQFRVQTLRFRANTFLGRYLASDRAPERGQSAPADTEQVVVLVPR